MRPTRIREIKMETLVFSGDYRNNGNGIPGKYLIYDDRIVFQPSSSYAKFVTLGKGNGDFEIEMSIADITKCEKKLLGFLNIYDCHGNVMMLNVFKKTEIIAAIESRKQNLKKTPIILQRMFAPTVAL